MALVSTTICPAILIMSLGVAATARADFVSTPNVPAFSPGDEVVIARNNSLKFARLTDPWLVYHILRQIDPTGPTDRSLQTPDPDAPNTTFDPRKDPDLQNLPRVSPEAALDLSILIKNASANRPKP